METPKIHRKPVPKFSSDHAEAATPRRQASHGDLRVRMDAPEPERQLRTMRSFQVPRRGASPAPSVMTFAPPPPYTPYTYDAVAPVSSREVPPPLPRRPSERSSNNFMMESTTIGQFGLGLTSSPSTTAPVSPKLVPTATGLSSSSSAQGSTDITQPSFWKTAIDETRFFAGGLIQKAYESTKHYTIVRHSAGLVLYRGPTTNVVVTIFSSPEKPISLSSTSSSGDHITVWLQRRGYSGDTGLRLKTLVGASSSWLDVTPERQAKAGELSAADERGYQRDIHKFMKKTVPGKHYEKSVAGRVPRDTLFVRIPATCADGYFRLIVCSNASTKYPQNGGTQKKKVLCGSPVFRVASMSTDASIFRGASLSTLPMEASVKIATLLGTRYVAGAAAPILGTVQNKVSKFQPGTVVTTAAQTAYDNSKLSRKVGSADESYHEARTTAYESLSREADQFVDDQEDVPPEVIGDDSGPSKPFPLQFQGRVVPGTGRSTAEMSIPTANLADVPDDVRLRLRGVYFGWASIVPSQKSIETGTTLPIDWMEVVVIAAPLRQPSKTSVVQRNEVSTHLLYEFGSASLIDSNLKLIVMAFLSPDTNAVSSAAPLVVSSLSRLNWGPQATLARIETEQSARSLPDKLTDKYVDTRGRVQKQVDRIPFHWAGVRTAGGEMRDQLYGKGGYWVQR